jgi:DNA-binding Lrp family transcriptional regulator
LSSRESEKSEVPFVVDGRDFEILKYLSLHPTCSMNEIAEALGYRPETVSAHLRAMKERGLYSGTMGLLSYQKLNMAYVPVLVRAPLTKVQQVYDVTRAHPYIGYSVRTLGATEGAYILFTPPQQATPLLIQFLDELAARGTITDYRFFVCDDRRRAFITPDLRIFKPETGAWEFDWKRWLEADGAIEKGKDAAEPQTPARTQLQPQPRPSLLEPELHRLNRADIRLLQIITDDAKMPTEEIAKATGLELQVVRRRIQRLEEDGFIVSYRAMITFSKFHLSSTMLFDCNATAQTTETCKRKLLTLPFPGTVVPVQNGFLCQVTLPAEGLPPVHKYLTKHCTNVEVSWFDLPTSDVAILNSNAYAETGWRTDPAYMIQEPLRAVSKQP